MHWYSGEVGLIVLAVTYLLMVTMGIIHLGRGEGVEFRFSVQNHLILKELTAYQRSMNILSYV